jgi:hypothetical protein
MCAAAIDKAFEALCWAENAGEGGHTHRVLSSSVSSSSSRLCLSQDFDFFDLDYVDKHRPWETGSSQAGRFLAAFFAGIQVCGPAPDARLYASSQATAGLDAGY